MKFRLLWNTGANIIFHMDTIIIKWSSTLTETVHISAKLNKFEKADYRYTIFWSVHNQKALSFNWRVFWTEGCVELGDFGG